MDQTFKKRMDMLKTATKQLIDGLTKADFVSIVDFDTEAKTFQNLQYMARATQDFRASMKKFVDEMEADGNTAYDKAFELAFTVADTSYAQNYDSGCQTVFVFLTDGARSEGADPTALIRARQQKDQKRKEMFVIIGLGSDVNPTETAGKTLQKLACDIGGVFESVSDMPQGATDAQKTRGNAELLRALSAFSRYFQATNAIQKREYFSFSEIYEGTNFPMEMTTAVAPVYDKTDPSRWKMLGVVGIDITICDLEKQIYEKDNSVQTQLPSKPEDTVIDGCKCAGTFTYEGETYDGCTSSGWTNRSTSLSHPLRLHAAFVALLCLRGRQRTKSA